VAGEAAILTTKLRTSDEIRGVSDAAQGTLKA